MTAGLRPYPVYKDSGVPWLGRVPEHWDVLPNRAIFVEINDRDHPQEEMLSVTITGGVIPQRALLQHGGKKDGSNQDKSAYKLVLPGDMAYNKMRAWQGAIGVSGYRGIVSPAYVVHRPRARADSRYLHHLYRTPAFATEAERWSYGITSDMWSLRPEHFRMIYGCLPPPTEQSSIVRFLDHHDRKIRRHIRAKQKLIQLLEEQKQAIIHRVVTRGLDPNVRLKPSGVDWLGDVPEHWEVKRLHQITHPERPIMYGIVLPGPDVDDGVLIVKGGDCEAARMRPDRLCRTSVQIEARYARSRLAAGDVVFGIRGGVGAAALVPPELAGANLTQDAARIAPAGTARSQWLLHAVRAPAFREHVNSQMVGATVRGINIRDLKRIPIVVPPCAEQADVARYLDNATRGVISAVESAERETALLREYRTRLTADVVTGKLDVCEAAARLPVEPDDPDETGVAEASSLPLGDNDVGDETEDAEVSPEEAEAET